MENKAECGLPSGKQGSLNNWIWIAMVYLLVFQNPLERISGVFKYVDEFAAVASVLIWFLSSLRRGEVTVKHYLAAAAVPLLIFTAAGLAGNFLYRYQPWSQVLKDLFANLKFYLALMTGYGLASRGLNRVLVKDLGMHLRWITFAIFALFCLERITPVFGLTEVRYGMRTAQLFFQHATYLAGTMAFLAVALTVFFEKKNLPFIGMALMMMMFTLRSKAIVSAMMYVVLYMIVVVIRGKVKLWHVAVLGLAAVIIGWEQISFYFIELSGGSARSVMTATSFQIAGDYFPLGTGFATYGSSAAAEQYSPVYVMYGFDDLYELASWNPNAFLNDTFWPIIIGQTGVIGTAAYLALMLLLVSGVFRLRQINRFWFLGGLFIVVYLLISSTAEPAFNNAVSIPLAMLLGGLFRQLEKKRHGDRCKKTKIAFQ